MHHYPFKTETTHDTAPFGGVLVGMLETPVVYPGTPVCHLGRVDDRTQRAIERSPNG